MGGRPVLQEKYIADIAISACRIEIQHGPLLEPFLRSRFYVEYDGECDLAGLDEAVAVVPFVLATAAVVWSAGLQLQIDRLDASLAESLPRLKAVYAEMYPGIAWNGNIEVLQSVRAANRGGGAGMLFSGGLDSIHTALSIPGRKKLFTVWGADTDPDKDLPWSHIRQRTLSFAESYGHTPIFARSNFRQFLKAERLHTWHKEISHWYAHVQHGPALIGLTVPVMVLDGADKLLIAGSHAEGELQRGWGSSRALDESIQFGNVTVTHAGSELSRQQKMHAVVQTCRTSDKKPFPLRVCPSLKNTDDSNCGLCEKCLRTAIGLIVEGEDPRDWGLSLSPLSTLKVVKAKLSRFQLKMTANEVPHWNSIQERARRYNAPAEQRDYLKWFVKINLTRHSAMYQIFSGRIFYVASPRPLKGFMRKMYYKYR
jgi:hypothetical protein